MNAELRIIPIKGIGEIAADADLGKIIYTAIQAQGLQIEASDILVITQKIVSKAEGRVVQLDEIQPSAFAKKFANEYKKDAQHVEVVLQESHRIVRMSHGVLISETEHGFICANAGVDESNVNGARQLTLLPHDSDLSARKIRTRLQQLTSENARQAEVPDLAIIISDTWGRPWRNGQVNMAIGVAGMESIADYRGQDDPYGYRLEASAIAVADELASAAELVMGKIDQIPVALIRGYHYTRSESDSRMLIRDASTDMFR
ncbi:MAG TPA: coenzyme F420-0:L-glutamate ligase [Ktedonobacteraceae bacterium]|nr:coenzyme F420-0:L-glutamate ligase [Ktedonobacteraceae bacterium]